MIGHIWAVTIGGVARNDDMQDGRDHTPLDRALSRLAARQHGTVALRQLTALGLKSSSVRSRVAGGRLHRVHRGVYSVGHPLLTVNGWWMAAVLACGEGAALSHRSAAALLGLCRDERETIDVTTPRRAGRKRAAINAHSGCHLNSSDLTTVNAIPCTTVPRTLLDISEVVNRRTLERAVDRAEILRVFDLRALEEVLSRADGRRGVAVLRSILEEYAEPAIAESELEERVLALCVQFRIRRPLVNLWITLEGGAVKVDFLWAKEKLVLEADGRHVHGSRRAFEEDRRRDQRLMLAGYRVMRCTWRQIVHHSDEVAATLVRLLGDT